MDISRSRSRRVKITYAVDWPQQKTGGHLLAPNAAREMNDGRVVSVGKDTTVRVWKDEKNIRTYDCHVDSVNDVDVSVSDTTQLVATAGSDNKVCVIDINKTSMSPRQSHTEHTDAVKRVRFTIDNHLVSVGLDGKAITWDLTRGCAVSRHSTDTGFFSVGVSPSSSRTVLGCMKGSLYSIDTRESNGACLKYQEHAHVGTVRDITFIDDTVFATGGSDGVVRLWDLRNPRKSYKQHYHLHQEPVFSLATKDHYVLSASRDGQVLLTDPQGMQTATVIQMNYPIFNISWNSISHHVTVCSSKPHVELFELSTGDFDDDFDATPYMTPNNASRIIDGSAVTTASPSKVDLILERESETLLHIEGRKYGRATYRELAHDGKEAEKRWCTSVTNPRLRDDEFSLCDSKTTTQLAPSRILRGSNEGFVSAKLLSDKRHALAMRASGLIELWNIIEMKKIDGPHNHARSMKEAAKMCGTYAFGASWCRIDCAWGALRITLSHDEAFNAQANAWEYQYLSSIDDAKDKLSIYRFSAEQRREMEKNIVNIGEEMLRRWHRGNSEVYVVHTKQGGNEASTSAYTAPIRTTFTDTPDGKIPTWALTCLSSGPSARSTPSNASVNVTLEPFEVGTKYKTINIAVAKTQSVADLCAEVVSRNNIHGTPSRSDEQIEFLAAPSTCMFDDSADDEDDSDSESESTSAPPAGNLSSSIDKRDRVVDPLMMVVTAFYTYKERGSGTLRLKYRTRNTRVKPDDL